MPQTRGDLPVTMSSSTLYLFGDQSAEFSSSIQHLTRQSRQCDSLHRFLRAATDIIQETLAGTPAHLRPQCRPFDSPLQLVEAIDPEQDCTAFVSALLSISQLGSFILWVVLPLDVTVVLTIIVTWSRALGLWKALLTRLSLESVLDQCPLRP